MQGDVFIKNATRYDLIVPVAVAKEGDTVLKRQDVMFRTRTVDPTTGRILSTGFTRVTSEEFSLYKADKTFAKLLEKGRLVEFGSEDLPADALSESDVIVSLQERIAALEKENAALKKASKKEDSVASKPRAKSKG